jgi:hypothetical protein
MRYMTVIMLLAVCAARGASIVHTIPAPGDGVLGLGWEASGSLWAVDNASDWVFELDPATGNVLFSFYPDYSAAYNIYGLACSSDTLFINFGKATGGGMFSMYDCDTGAYLGNVALC